MAGVIVLSGVSTAPVTDVLNDTRLQTVPRGGVLTFEFQCDQNSASAGFDVSVQMPNGDTPLNGVRVPAGETSGALNSNDKMMISLPVTQGGHATVSFNEIGTAVLAWRITFSPVR